MLLLKIPEQTKTCSKSTAKECLRNAILVALSLAWKIFLKYVMESDFLDESVADLFLAKHEVFTINSSEQFCERVCNGI